MLKKEKQDIGIGIKPPEKKCQDKKCAWHGELSVRGKIFHGTVRSRKSKSTIIVEWGYHRFVKKYERYERRKSRVTVYRPECMSVKEGDKVVVAECRPLSKTKSFVVVGFEK